eukprot:scaffold28461_cov47-Prasinocladus_malaysianus.AAC.1
MMTGLRTSLASGIFIIFWANWTDDAAPRAEQGLRVNTRPSLHRPVNAGWSRCVSLLCRKLCLETPATMSLTIMDIRVRLAFGLPSCADRPDLSDPGSKHYIRLVNAYVINNSG